MRGPLKSPSGTSRSHEENLVKYMLTIMSALTALVLAASVAAADIRPTG
jgi:hypothetical protein